MANPVQAVKSGANLQFLFKVAVALMLINIVVSFVPQVGAFLNNPIGFLRAQFAPRATPAS